MAVIVPSYRIFPLKELCYVVAFLRLHFLRPTLQFLWLWLWKWHVPGMAVVCFTKSGLCQGSVLFLFPGFLILGDVISQLLEILFRALTLPDLSYIYSTIGPSPFNKTCRISNIVDNTMYMPGSLRPPLNVPDPEEHPAFFPVNLS